MSTPRSEKPTRDEHRLPIPESVRRLLWDASLVAALLVIVFLSAQVRGFTVPFVIAFIIAYMLDPIVDWFEDRGMSRTIAIGLILTSFISILTVVGMLVVPQVAQEFAEVPSKFKRLLSQLQPWLETQLQVALPSNVSELVSTLSGRLESGEFTKFVGPVQVIGESLFGGTMSALNALVTLTTVPIFAFFLLRDFDLIVAKLIGLVPRAYRPFIGARFSEIDRALSGFIRGQVSVATILTVLYVAGFSAVGLPLAFVVGLVAGIGNLIPFVGTALGVVFATLMLLLDGQGWGQAGAVAGVFIVVQLLESWVITPKIVGESVGLSTLGVIISFMVFGELFGFYGLLLAIPLAAIFKILVRELLEAYTTSRFFNDEIEPPGGDSAETAVITVEAETSSHAQE